MIDRRSLKAGEHFGKMKKVYVIFICDYDPFGYDRALYTIKNRCLEEPELPYEDDAETWVLYTRGKKGNISESLRQLLSYMENTNQNNAINEDLRDIQQKVDQVKRDGEVSLRYMKWFEHDQMMYEQGRQDEQENTEREKELTRHLLKDQRVADAQRALDDPAFRDQLLKEYGIH